MNENTVIHWSVLTIGHLSRNRFWGEDDATARRSPLCTSVLLRCAPEETILVDPPLPPDEMAGLLDRRAGITPADVTRIFLTHFHGDHRIGLDAFPDVPWQMSDREFVYWDTRLAKDAPERRLLARITPVPAEGGRLVSGVTTIHLPGHTPGLTGLRFDDPDGNRVVIAADAAMTRDFFEARAGYFNSDDFEQCAQSIDRLRAEADVIVPGHDNFFHNARRAAGRSGVTAA